MMMIDCGQTWSIPRAGEIEVCIQSTPMYSSPNHSISPLKANHSRSASRITGRRSGRGSAMTPTRMRMWKRSRTPRAAPM